MKSRASFLIALVTLLSFSAQAYEFSTGKLFMRGTVGPTINVFKQDTTPGGGLMLSGEVEYVVSKPWSIIGGMRPVFATGSIDLEFGIGGKYRWDDLGVPLVLYTSLELTPALLLPTNGAATHFNLGLRPSVGLDYFVMRDLVVGTQLAIDPSWLMTQQFASFEASIEFLLSVMYRI